MEKEKLESILNDLSNKSNKDLFEAEEFLFGEFEKTKALIVDLTKHIDIIEEFHRDVMVEIEKRKSV
jgi:hypothetical protein